jgi:hypothetical protein
LATLSPKRSIFLNIINKIVYIHSIYQPARLNLVPTAEMERSRSSNAKDPE